MATISPEDVRKAGAKSKSGLLATALKNGELIIAVTVQTFPFALDEIRADKGLKGKRFAVIADEAHTALGDKTSAAIRAFSEPIYIGMTATEQLIAKQVSDVFPASVDDLPLGDAARRGLIAPLRSLRVRPAAAISSVPIVGGDYDPRAVAQATGAHLVARHRRHDAVVGIDDVDQLVTGRGRHDRCLP